MIADALTQLPARTPNVPHEFVGQARLFCARIDAAAQRQGISRTAWLHAAASKAFE